MPLLIFATGVLLLMALLVAAEPRLMSDASRRHDALLRRAAWRDSGIWLVALLSVAAVHGYYSLHARSEAEQVLAHVLRLREQLGRYPSPQELPWQGLGPSSTSYRLEGQHLPVLWRRASIGWLDTWQYDFDARTWRFRPLGV